MTDKKSIIEKYSTNMNSKEELFDYDEIVFLLESVDT